jgi:hypothetical protein
VNFSIKTAFDFVCKFLKRIGFVKNRGAKLEIKLIRKNKTAYFSLRKIRRFVFTSHYNNQPTKT